MERIPIMRKDVKLAFIVGGILISVLVVYVLVVPGGGQKKASNQPVPFDTKSSKTETASAEQKSSAHEKTAQKDAGKSESKPRQ